MKHRHNEYIEVFAIYEFTYKINLNYATQQSSQLDRLDRFIENRVQYLVCTCIFCVLNLRLLKI